MTRLHAILVGCSYRTYRQSFPAVGASLQFFLREGDLITHAEFGIFGLSTLNSGSDRE